MGEFDISNATTSELKGGVPDYKVQAKTIVEAGPQPKTYSTNHQFWSTRLGYYKTIPELKQAVDSLALWTAGKGYKTDNSTKSILETLNGWGEDTFDSL